ncbi:MAG: YHS domain-containing protein, partial [Planctomycetota bacterium]
MRPTERKGTDMRMTAALTLLLLLCTPALAADEELTNRTCPVMKGEEVDPDLHLDYKGRRVYFCCEDCVERFRNDPERYVVNLTNTESYYFGADPAEAEGVRVVVDWGDEDEHKYGVLHFVFLHFPLALSAVAALAALLGLVFRGAFYKNA